MPLAKAMLKEVHPTSKQEINTQRAVTVQFNPETLKVTYTNQVSQGSGRNATQHVGAGATKLAVQLLFDVNAAGDEATATADVRELTEKVVYFITPQGEGRARVPPLLRFAWGTFQFDGVVESLDESLEFFSPEGRPLRASLSLSLAQPQIVGAVTRNPSGQRQPLAPASGAAPGAPRREAGTTPLTPAPQGGSVQRMAGQSNAGDSSNWRDVAQANGIEDPLRLAVGSLIDLSPSLRGRA